MHAARLTRRRLAALLGRGAVIALASLSFAVAPASAARTWHPPVDIAVAGDAISNVHVAATARGETVAVWIDGETHRTGAHFPLGTVFAAVRPAGGPWEAPVDLSAGAPATNVDLAVDAHGTAVAVWGVSFGVVTSAVRPAGGDWQAPVGISGPVDGVANMVSGAHLAVDPAGDAVAIWSRAAYPHDVVESASRPAGGDWQAPVAVTAADGDVFAVGVALDPAGTAVAIFSHYDPEVPGAPLQSVVRPAGGSWQPPVAIPMPPAGERSPSRTHLGVDAQGNVVAIWVREEFGTGAGFVQGAARSAGAASPWQSLDVSADGARIDDIDLAVDGQGNAVALWSRAGAPGGGVQSALRPVGGAWQPPVTLSAPGQSARGGDVEIDAQGNAVAVWQRVAPDFSSVAQAAVRPAGKGWQAPVDLSGAGRGAGGAQVAVDAHGDAIAVWSSRTPTDDVLQSAAYDSTQPAPARPTVSRLRLSHRTFRAARSGPPVLQASARGATRVSYALDAAASVRFTVRRVRGGRVVGGHCVRPASGNRGHRVCARAVRVRGSFTRRRPAGSDRFTFTAHLAGRTLAPGAYTLVASPGAGGRAGTPARASFRVVR